ncbi:MAG: indole-3-glycerol phosphate synthase TrpC [Candidatus Methanomethylophilaceae archaeon]|nr:indole-3-glycerol phosphate synthase TrpC [Candidatus Methanomethylophilaceae archaeon]
MTDILSELAGEARRRVIKSMEETPPEELKSGVRKLHGFPFEEALKKEGMSFICEIKKASPSKGIISEDFPYLEIAKEYEAAGASCISVLTEPSRFLGKIDYLSEISKAVGIPVLRKDFVVDEYMIYEAWRAGASAVLLICSILDEQSLERFIGLCHSLGMSALVEVHDAGEVSAALRCGARIVGVNNRNLRDFTVDARNCLDLRPLVPEGVIFVAESGIGTRSDVEILEKNGVDAVLVGESLMKSADKSLKLSELRGYR